MIFQQNSLSKTLIENPFLQTLLRISAFLIPLTILATLLYIYYLPLGFTKHISMSQQRLLETTGELYIQDKTKIYNIETEPTIDGIIKLSYKPRVPKRDLQATVKVKGENFSVIPSTLENTDLLDIWEYQYQPTPDDKEAQFKLFSQYSVKQEDTLAFNLKVVPGNIDTFSKDLITEADYKSPYINNRLIMKYKNIRLIQRYNTIQLIADELFDDTLNSHTVSYTLQEKDLNTELSIIAVYNKPRGNNGYIKLYVNNSLGGIVTIPSIEKNILTKYTYPWYEVTYSESLVEDLNQKYISLYQEEFTENLTQIYQIPPTDLERIYRTYSHVYGNSNEYYRYLTNEQSFYNDTFESFFEFDNNRHATQTFYPKIFFEPFDGIVKEIKVGYEDPVIKKIETTSVYPITPFDILLWGENTKDINVDITFSKNSLINRQ